MTGQLPSAWKTEDPDDIITTLAMLERLHSNDTDDEEEDSDG